VLQATLAFWTVEGLEVVNVLTYGGVQAAPVSAEYLCQLVSKRVLTFGVPLACVAYLSGARHPEADRPARRAPDWILPADAAGRICLPGPLFPSPGVPGMARYASTGS